jgi:hypothetical protein
MKYLVLGFLLITAESQSVEDGNSIPEPLLTDYSNAQRQPGILGSIEELQDAEGNPVSF